MPDIGSSAKMENVASSLLQRLFEALQKDRRQSSLVS